MSKGVPSRTSAPTPALDQTYDIQIILGKVRPLSRHLAKAHPQVLIIALVLSAMCVTLIELPDLGSWSISSSRISDSGTRSTACSETHASRIVVAGRLRRPFPGIVPAITEPRRDRRCSEP
ncbi:hypothetical protein FVO80_19540 [Mycobacterium avium subsp. hominissuis]|nr:hypothetical protein [Mycobacterium avium subsp. hominissuis]MBZ4552080.1 hypothetical protein [Mycobacterium avium subsp. hominissuis]MBZ4580349.1 hypothetical protein [Mycobacterium avium subsp. hominissuis]MBZ4594239.1 hypothetical protein [Mycobacterium avium subsp. hominissuis]MBZ4598000.1 hypothetical protein [Mycobacterium avium subsp. hominissuis]